MRIRKYSRKVSVGFPPGGSQVFSTWKGWDRDCGKPSQTNSAGVTSAEAEPWVDFRSMSGRPASIPVADQGHAKATPETFSNQCDKPENISENSNRVRDLNLSKDRVMMSQEGEHVTRHYVRRRKDGDGAPPVKSDFPKADENAADRTIHKRSDIDALRSGEELQGRLRTDPSMAGDLTCTLSNKSEPSLDKEIQNHPSREPEGLLLHALYLQLLAAGTEGLTLRELFASFKTQTSLPSLGRDWKERVRAHLKTNPCFVELKGRLLMCEQIVQLDPKLSGSRAAAGWKSAVTTHLQSSDSAGIPTAPHFNCNSNDIHEGICQVCTRKKGIQTRRKTYQNTIEAALNESAVEFQKLQQDAGRNEVTATDLKALNSVSPPATEEQQNIQSTALPMPSSRKRRFLSRNDEDILKSIKYGRATPGALIALQAKIVAESGEPAGVRCARGNGCGNWQCPLMALEGHALCEHHIFLKERRRAQNEEAAKRRNENKRNKRRQLRDKLEVDQLDEGVPESQSDGDEDLSAAVALPWHYHASLKRRT